MAVLNQSELWPIHSARGLHDKAQQEFLWQFFISGAIPIPNEDMMLLAQSVTLPPMTFEQKSYQVAGEEKYYLGNAKRGGAVSARFLETEDGKVDTFFRLWNNEVAYPSPGLSSLTRKETAIGRARRGKGFGDGITGHSRYGLLRMLKRDGSVGVELLLIRLQLLSFGARELKYDGTGPLILSVEMTCDDVVRNVFA